MKKILGHYILYISLIDFYLGCLISSLTDFIVADFLVDAFLVAGFFGDVLSFMATFFAGFFVVFFFPALLVFFALAPPFALASNVTISSCGNVAPSVPFGSFTNFLFRLINGHRFHFITTPSFSSWVKVCSTLALSFSTFSLMSSIALSRVTV